MIGSIGTALSSMGALALAAITHVRGEVKDRQKAIANAKSKLGKYAKPVRNALIALVVTLAGPILLLAVAVLGVRIAVSDGPEARSCTRRPRTWSRSSRSHPEASAASRIPLEGALGPQPAR